MPPVAQWEDVAADGDGGTDLAVGAAGLAQGSTDTVRLEVSPAAAEGAGYTVAVPDALADTRTPPNAVAASTEAAVAYVPISASTVSYEVRGPDGTARPAPFEALAREGDTIVITLGLSGAADPARPPTVLFVGKSAAADRVTMSRVGATDSWTAAYTVEPASAAPGIDGPFTFGAALTSAAGTRSAATQASVASPAPPTIDRVAPRATSATFASAVSIEVAFSEDVRVPASGWTVTARAPASGSLDVSAAAPKPGAADTAILTVAAASSGVEYRVGIPATLTDLAGNARSASTPTRDATYTAQAFFSAETLDARTVRVTFDEAISGTTAPSEWRVGAATPAGIAAGASQALPGDTALDSAAGITLRLDAGDALAGTGATPEVSYIRPAGQGANELANAAGTVQGAAGTAVGTTSSDSAPPVASITFAAANTIVVTFTEALAESTLPASWDVEAEGAAVALDATTPATYAAASASSTVTILLAADAAAGVEHEVAIPNTITDLNSNAYSGKALSAERKAGVDTTSPSFTATTVAPHRIAIEFDEPVVGSTSVGDWDVDGAAPTGMQCVCYG